MPQFISLQDRYDRNPYAIGNPYGGDRPRLGEQQRRSGPAGAMEPMPPQGPLLADEPPPINPALASRGGMPTANPALQGEQAAGPTEIDPEIGRETARVSAKAVKTASEEDKKNVTEALEDIHGKGSVEKAYKQALERLGGEKEFDPKLTRQDWGMFLMDFGMRLAAAAGQPHATLGGSIGEAGVGALQGMQGRTAQRRDDTVEYNEQAREEARAPADMELEQQELGAEQQSALSDPKNVLWTKDGAYNMRTGKYVMGPGGKPLQPGLTPGQGNRPFADQQQIAALMRAGYSEAEAVEIRSGGLTNSEIREAARKAWTVALKEADKLPSPVTGELKIPRRFDATERKAWRDEYFNEVKGIAGSAGGPALDTPPRAPATGGALPPPPWETDR